MDSISFTFEYSRILIKTSELFYPNFMVSTAIRYENSVILNSLNRD